MSIPTTAPKKSNSAELAVQKLIGTQEGETASKTTPRTNWTASLVGTKLRLEVELDPDKVDIALSKGDKDKGTAGDRLMFASSGWIKFGIGTLEGTVSVGIPNPNR